MAEIVNDDFSTATTQLLTSHTPNLGVWIYPHLNLDDSLGEYSNVTDNPVNLGLVDVHPETEGGVSGAVLRIKPNASNKCVFLQAPAGAGADMFGEIIVETQSEGTVPVANIMAGQLHVLFRVNTPGTLPWANYRDYIGGGIEFRYFNYPRVYILYGVEGSVGYNRIAWTDAPTTSLHTYTVRVEIIGNVITTYVDTIPVITANIIDLGAGALTGAGDVVFMFTPAVGSSNDAVYTSYYDTRVGKVRAGSLPEAGTEFWTNFRVTREIL